MRFEMKKDVAGQRRFCIIADNGETIAQSEGYVRRIDRLNAIALIRAGAAGADFSEVEVACGTLAMTMPPTECV
jgi:uncharacterized protein YegP (UPF0339 family)